MKNRPSSLNQNNMFQGLKSFSLNNTNDVSFSIPEWRQQQRKSFNQQYERQIYQAVPLSLTDFETKQEIQFLSPPEKCTDQKFAYERKLMNNQDFSILVFLICIEQILIKNRQEKSVGLQILKKKLNDMDLCMLKNIPTKMEHYYDNKILKKILFQYINKGSYNVSLLEILLKKNPVLKFCLSLVSKSILGKRGLISSYNQFVTYTIQMKNCGDEFGILQSIKIKQKSIETENFLIQMVGSTIKLLRKQNIVKMVEQKNIKPIKKQQKRPLTPTTQIIRRISSRKSKKDSEKASTYGLEDIEKQTTVSTTSKKQGRSLKRSSSLINFFRRIICS